MSDSSPLENNYGSPTPAPEETWLTSYGDLMTILLVFFVLLISASNISSMKFERIKNAFLGPTSAEFSIAKVHEQIEKKVQEKNMQDMVEVVDDDTSIAVIVKDRLLFDLGETTIKEENKQVLAEFIELFQGLPEYARIAIEGYTDDVPVNPTRYRSNWHLSVLRALSVLEEFNKFSICKENCELRGFGEYRPVKPNRDIAGNGIEENQTQNRRVVIRLF